MKKLIFLAVLFSAQAFATSLPEYIRSKANQIESELTAQYEYTFKVDYDGMKCLERETMVENRKQKVGVCLVNVEAIEEYARAVFSITVSSFEDQNGDNEITILQVDNNL